MRSPTSRSTSHRRLHQRPPSARSLEALAGIVDDATAGDPGHVLVHVLDDGDELVLGLAGLEPDIHPFEVLAGCTAPPEWSVFGIRVCGTAHHLHDDLPAERSATTFLVERGGSETSLLRQAHEVHPLPGPAAGTIPDLCRRVLDLPTDPAPPTTAALWTLAWVDRIVEAWGEPARRARLRTFAHVAMLHPAVSSATDADLLRLDEPARLVAVGRGHTAAWPWARLRAEPAALPLPDGDLPVDVTQWMDDGFYARWAFGSFPPIPELVHDLADLLPAELRAPVLHVIEATLATVDP